MVTAFGANPDGEGILLRVWEQVGVSGELTIELPNENIATKAMQVNLRGERIGREIIVRDARLTFELGAFAPVSFLLE
jgi:hypothetical protein